MKSLLSRVALALAAILIVGRTLRERHHHHGERRRSWSLGPASLIHERRRWRTRGWQMRLGERHWVWRRDTPKTLLAPTRLQRAFTRTKLGKCKMASRCKKSPPE